MTRSRDTGGPNADEPEGEELESGGRSGAELEDAALLNPLLIDDDGLPLLPLLDAEAGPARPLAAQELLVLVDRVERQFAQRGRSVSRLTPRRRLLLAGGLFAASAAAAVVGVGVVRRGAEPAAVTLPVTSPVTRPAEVPLPAVGEAPPSAAEPSVVAPPPAPVPPPDEATEPGTNEQPADEHVPKAAGPAPKSSNSSASSANLPSRASRVGLTGRSNYPQNERQSGTVAADRLAAANSLRSRHRYREALALYLQVIEIAPNGMQASVARVAAADMKLEQFGDVAGAERLYRDARTQGGELTTEAQFGLSQVARARGDVPGERRALQDFVGHHPESPLAAAARRRLNTLGAK